MHLVMRQIHIKLTTTPSDISSRKMHFRTAVILVTALFGVVGFAAPVDK
jgi:hypothetical protein